MTTATDSHTVREPTFRHLLRDLIHDGQRLLEDEFELAKAEMREKATRALRQTLILSIGASLALLGLIALLAAVAFGLAHALIAMGADPKVAMWLSPLIIGVLAAGIGVMMALRGVAELRKERLMPQRTLRSLRNSEQWLLDRLS